MTTRRKFLKSAGAITGALSMPVLRQLHSADNNINFNAAKTDDELFEMVRAQLLIPSNRIYLNTGSLGPSPLQVIDKVHSAMRQLESNPVVENWGDLGKAMEAVRGKVANFINAETDEILLTRNTTEGLSLVTQSLKLETGDEIITTTREHGGATIGMDFVAKNKGVTIKKVELPMPATSVNQIVQHIENGITPKTKLIILSHVNTITGLVMPFEAIAKITNEKGIVLVSDGAQAPGLIPVDVKALGVDAYAASGHKWMMGPKETGFLYLNKNIQEKIRTTFTSSGFAAYTAASGTRNVAVIAGLGEAIDFHQQIGVEKIRKRTLEIRNYCLIKLLKLDGVKVISPSIEALSSGIVSFQLENAKSNEIFTEMRKQDIIIKLLGNNSNRISCHIFVSKKDIDLFIEALKQML
jgi:isopenicillin-N epimerase